MKEYKMFFKMSALFYLALYMVVRYFSSVYELSFEGFPVNASVYLIFGLIGVIRGWMHIPFFEEDTRDAKNPEKIIYIVIFAGYAVLTAMYSAAKAGGVNAVGAVNLFDMVKNMYLVLLVISVMYILLTVVFVLKYRKEIFGCDRQ